MPNLISVTQSGRAPDFLVDRLKEVPGNVVKGKLAGTALRHPALAPILDLIFPAPLADGTLTEVHRHLKKQKADLDAGISGTFLPEPDDRRFDKIPEVFPTRTMDFRDANSNGIDDRDEPGYNSRPDFLGSFGKMELDPAVQQTLRQQQSQMDAGISGTFVPVR